MVDLPNRRYCMHLDTVFTFTSPTEAVYFPPIIGEGDLEGSVIHLTQGAEPERFDSRTLPSLKHALAEVVPYEITYIPCGDRKSTRLNSSHVAISYAVFCLKKKTTV